MAHFPAQFPGPEGREADGDAGLRNQSKAKKVPYPVGFSGEAAAGPGSDIFSQDPDQEIDHADHQQGNRADGAAVSDKGTEIKAKTAPEEEQQEDRWTEIIQLAEHPLILRGVDINHAHSHASQQGGNINHGANPTVGKKDCNSHDKAVIRAAPGSDQPFQDQAESSAQEHQQDSFYDGDQHISDLEAGTEKKRLKRQKSRWNKG